MFFKNVIVEDKIVYLFFKLKCVEDIKCFFISENGIMIEIFLNMKNFIVIFEMKMDQVKLFLGIWLLWICKIFLQNLLCIDCMCMVWVNDVRVCVVCGGLVLVLGVFFQKNQYGWFWFQLDELDVGVGLLQIRGGDVVMLGGVSGVYGWWVVFLVCLGGFDKCYLLVFLFFLMNCLI